MSGSLLESGDIRNSSENNQETPCDMSPSSKPSHDPFPLFCRFSVLKYFHEGSRTFSFLSSLRLFELEEMKDWVGQKYLPRLLICFETKTETEALKTF